jgi:hypothetical protein
MDPETREHMRSAGTKMLEEAVSRSGSSETCDGSIQTGQACTPPSKIPT